MNIYPRTPGYLMSCGRLMNCAKLPPALLIFHRSSLQLRRLINGVDDVALCSCALLSSSQTKMTNLGNTCGAVGGGRARSGGTSAGWVRCVCPSRVWSSWSGRCGRPVGTPSSRSKWSCKRRRREEGSVSARTDRLGTHQAVNMLLFPCFARYYTFSNLFILQLCCWWRLYFSTPATITPGKKKKVSSVDPAWIWMNLNLFIQVLEESQQIPSVQHRLRLFWLLGSRWAASRPTRGIWSPRGAHNKQNCK